MSHTPGPWKWFNYPDGRKLLCADSCAVIHAPDAPIGIEDDDAKVIAAAPDLLAALKALTQDSRFNLVIGGNPNTVNALVAQVDAAINKAEGR